MMTVSLQGMKFYAFHGYYAFEQRIGNTFEVDVEAELDTSSSPDEQLDKTLNYEEIYKITKGYMEKKYQLLETLAYDIAHDVKAYDNKVQKVTVKLSKYNPPIGGKVDRAVVTVSV